MSHEPEAWNFSENTAISECLVVARRVPNGQTEEPTKIVNLWTKPKSSIEALTFAKFIADTRGVLLSASGTDELVMIHGRKLGEVVLCPAEHIRAGRWGLETAFAQTELSRAAYWLLRGEVYVPGRGRLGPVPLAPLRTIGTVGPDRRDIHDAFRLSAAPTAYRALWGHDTESVQRIRQASNRYLSGRAHAARGRHLRDPDLMWSRAGRLIIGERLRLNTVRVVAIRLAEKALSNTWWPVAITGTAAVPAEDVECILALWLNSTLGLMSLMASHVPTEGPWVELKKPILHELPVLDPTKLTSAQRATLMDLYREVADADFLPLPELDRDETRAKIDATLMQVLGIADDLRELRPLIAVDQLLMARQAPPPADDEADEDEAEAEDAD